MNRLQALQAIQDRYFEEWQTACSQNPEAMLSELRRWEAADPIITGLSLDDQASYADYVTKKMCTEQPKSVFVEFASIVEREYDPNEKLNVCAIGNLAMVLKTTQQLEGHDDLKVRLQQHHANMIESQKRIRRGGSNCSFQ